MTRRGWAFYLTRTLIRLTALLIVLAAFGTYTSWVMGWR